MPRRAFLRGLVAANLFGASAPALSRIAGDVNAFVLAGVLYVGAALAVLPAGIARRPTRQGVRISWKPLGAAVLMGGAVAPVLLAAGLARTPAATASLLLNLELVATVILAAIDFHEHLGRQKGGAPGQPARQLGRQRVMLEQSYVGQPGPRLALGRRRHHHIGRRLSFATREHEGGGYGYATRDGIETHLGVVSDDQPSSAKHSAYLWVDGADALALAWRAAGAAVHLPEDTDWQQHEGAHVDPDGNVLRFGSPVGRSDADDV